MLRFRWPLLGGRHNAGQARKAQGRQLARFANDCDGAAVLSSAILHPVSTEPATTATPRGGRPLDLDALAHVKDERLRRLLRHWLERRGDRLAPLRSAIDPTAIGPILSSVWMCDYLPADRSFRMRLAGEDINRLYGRNVTQCSFEEIIAQPLLTELLRRYRRVVEEPAILHCGGNIYLASNRSEVGERLVLPLCDDSGAIRHAIGASVYRMELKVGEGPITRESMTETFTPLATTAGAKDS
jgi:hypothetical protein